MTDMIHQDKIQPDFRCGYIALIGPPNAGKSTLLNALVGAKVSIVSPKVQTTRTRVLGIVTQESSQMILMDTPGLFKPKKTLERAIVRMAEQTLEEAEILAVILDVSKKTVGEEARTLIHTYLKSSGKRPVVLILNKVDLVEPARLLLISSELNGLFDFSRTFMISALHRDGIDDLLRILPSLLPAGSPLFPEDQIADMSDRLLSAEITREKLFHRLHQEIPYGLTVETDQWENFENGDLKIGQTIFVTRENYKPIILGKGGQNLKAIGQAAREELQSIFDCRVHLSLFIKVRPKWTENAEHYRLWGLDIQ